MLFPLAETVTVPRETNVLLNEDQAAFLGCKLDATPLAIDSGDLVWPPLYYTRSKFAVELSAFAACAGLAPDPASEQSIGTPDRPGQL